MSTQRFVTEVKSHSELPQIIDQYIQSEPVIYLLVVFSDEVDFPSNHKEKVSRFIREPASIRSQNKK